MSVNGYNTNATEPVSNSNVPLTAQTFDDEFVRIEEHLIVGAPANQQGMPAHLNSILISISDLKKAAANLKTVPAAAETWEKLAALETRVSEQYTYYSRNRNMEGGKRYKRRHSRKFRARKNRRTRRH
jgi:hypothetical protein